MDAAKNQDCAACKDNLAGCETSRDITPAQKPGLIKFNQDEQEKKDVDEKNRQKQAESNRKVTAIGRKNC